MQELRYRSYSKIKVLSPLESRFDRGISRPSRDFEGGEGAIGWSESSTDPHARPIRLHFFDTYLYKSSNLPHHFQSIILQQ